MRVDVEKKNTALESLFTDPEQMIFLDINSASVVTEAAGQIGKPVKPEPRAV